MTTTCPHMSGDNICTVCGELEYRKLERDKLFADIDKRCRSYAAEALRAFATALEAANPKNPGHNCGREKAAAPLLVAEIAGAARKMAGQFESGKRRIVK